MMKRLAVILLIAAMCILAFGCSAHIHTVGNGPAGQGTESTRQWYILWGLVPLNEVDTNTMAGEAADYEIQTQITVLDFLITIPTSIITVNCRSVTVTK